MQNIKLSKGFTLIELIVVMAVFLLIIGAAIGIFLSIVQNQKRVLSEQQLLNQISYVEEYMSKALRMAKTEPATDSISPEPCLKDYSIGLDPADHPGYVYLLTRPDSNGIFRGIKFINHSDGDACEEFYLDTSTTPYVLKELKLNVCTEDNDCESGQTCDTTNRLCKILTGQESNYTVPLTSTNLQFDTSNPVRFSVNGSNGSNNDTAHSSVCHGTSYDCGASNTDRIQPRVTILFKITLPGDNQPRTIQTTVSRRTLNVAE